MALDRWIAVFFLAVSIIYGYAAFNYELLPFERNMAFLPNTMPMALSVVGALLSLVLLLAPGGDEADEPGDNIDVRRLRDYKLGQAVMLLIAMVLFAVLLRPLGFIAATTLFLVGSGMLLGERKFHLLIPIALAGALLIWYLVQELLGIFLRPWPGFLS